MASDSILATLVIICVTHLIHTVSSGVLDYPSDEDRTYQPPPDGSISAMKHEDSWNIDDLDNESPELSVESYEATEDIGQTFDFSSFKKKPKKSNSSLLLDVFKKADKYSQNAVRLASLTEKKVNDLSNRLYNFRYSIVGTIPPNNNQNGGGGGGGNFDYDDNGYGQGQGNAYSNRRRNNVGIVGSYYTIWPIIQEIGVLLNKLIEFSSKIATRLLLGPPVPAQQTKSRRRGRPTTPPSGKQKSDYQNQNRGPYRPSDGPKDQNRYGKW